MTATAASEIAFERGLPTSHQHELEVLSTCLADRDALDQGIVLLSPEDFSTQGRKVLWNQIRELHAAGKIPDANTVFRALQEKGKLQSIGSMADYLSPLPPVAGLFEQYCRILRVHAVRRRAIIEAQRIQELAYSGGEAEELVAELQRAGDALSSRKHRGTRLLTVAEAYQRDFEGNFANFIGEGEKTPAFPIPWEEPLEGLRNGEMTILAARPAVGKSSAAAQIAFQGAVQGRRVHLWTLEMRAGVTIRRAISALSLVSHYQMNLGWVKDEKRKAVFEALTKAVDSPLMIADDAQVTVEQMRQELRQAKAIGMLPELVIVDYLQLMQGVGQNRNDVVSSITRGLKRLTLEFGVAVLALSQLSRDQEKQGKREPMLSDLRDSGSIEQDADNVVFLHVDSKDNPGLDGPEKPKVLVVQWLVKKQRNGGTGMVKLLFTKALMRFERNGSSQT